MEVEDGRHYQQKMDDGREVALDMVKLERLAEEVLAAYEERRVADYSVYTGVQLELHCRCCGGLKRRGPRSGLARRWVWPRRVSKRC